MREEEVVAVVLIAEVTVGSARVAIEATEVMEEAKEDLTIVAVREEKENILMTVNHAN